MNFGRYAQDIASGRTTSYAFHARPDGDRPDTFFPPPMSLGHLYSVQPRPGGPILAYIRITSVRLIQAHQLSATNTAQFPDFSSLQSFVGTSRHLWLVSFSKVDHGPQE